jgi:hypothetical protein
MQSGTALILPTNHSLPKHYGFLEAASLFSQLGLEESYDIHHLLVTLAGQFAHGSVAES